LSIAIWFASEFGAEAAIIKDLLERLEDPDDMFLPGYYGAGTQVTFVSAVHIAAGLGQLEILQILTTHAHLKASPSKRMTPEAYVSQWAHLCPAGTSADDYSDPSKRKQFTRFYQPIHDSSYAGNGDVTLYLLKQRADPCTRNINQITPLHFVSFVGIQGTLESAVGDHLHKIVAALQRTGKAVGAKADMSNFIPGAKDVTPLEVAVEDASRFPQDYLGLLAPCLADGSQLTYFDDIKRIADVTADGALKLVRNIGEKGQTNLQILRRFRINAQMEGKSDVLASIFYTAPRAASEMLELLEVAPEVEDASHHSIPAKASLWGLFANNPMRCTYQSDVIKKESLYLPYWNWKSKGQREDAKEVNWHTQFIPIARRQARSTHIKNVQVVVSLLPGILDIDIFMAYAQVQHEHLAIMSQKTVQGSIFCLWNNLVESVWMVETMFRFLDMWAYVALSVLVHEGSHFGSLCWPVIAAGNLYAMFMLIAQFVSLLRKWSECADDETMHEMWSPVSKWNLVHQIPQCIQVLLSTLLVVDIGFLENKAEIEGTRRDDILIATCLLLACFRFIFMWRLSVVGSRIYTICQTFLAGAVNQMLFITFMLLFSFVVALQVLSRMHSWRLAVDSYRGFLFGDGDGFNGLGMDIDPNYTVSNTESNATLLGFSVFGSFFFNVIVLNIIIAIYGNEYDRVERDTPLLFMKGRADYCVKTLLSCYHVAWRGEAFNRFLTLVAVMMLFLGVSVAKYNENLWLSSIFLACGQVLLPMALVQCAWFSPEGQDSDDNARYLWICHPRDWQWTSDEFDFEDGLHTVQEEMEGKVAVVDHKIAALDDKFDRMMYLMQTLVDRDA